MHSTCQSLIYLAFKKKPGTTEMRFYFAYNVTKEVKSYELE